MPYSSEHPTHALLTPEQANLIAQNFSAFAEPTRARLVFTLAQGEQNVSSLAEMVGASISTVSHHLARLRDLHLVKTRRVANQVFYCVDDAHIAAIYREMLAHLDHVKRNLPDHDLDSLFGFQEATEKG
jgi:DNA-binding transcriptional ArsR family regulator